jgi:hypothetical protein
VEAGFPKGLCFTNKHDPEKWTLVFRTGRASRKIRTAYDLSTARSGSRNKRAR